MKLAVISPDFVACCLVCSWKWKAPALRKKQELIQEERLKVLEQNVLAHLRDAHDRILLTRDYAKPQDGEGVGKIYYNGRRPVTRF